MTVEHYQEHTMEESQAHASSSNEPLGQRDVLDQAQLHNLASNTLEEPGLNHPEQVEAPEDEILSPRVEVETDDDMEGLFGEEYSEDLEEADDIGDRTHNDTPLDHLRHELNQVQERITNLETQRRGLQTEIAAQNEEYGTVITGLRERVQELEQERARGPRQILQLPMQIYVGDGDVLEYVENSPDGMEVASEEDPAATPEPDDGLETNDEPTLVGSGSHLFPVPQVQESDSESEEEEEKMEIDEEEEKMEVDEEGGRMEIDEEEEQMEIDEEEEQIDEEEDSRDYEDMVY